jgi:hypothetical protein
MRLAIAPSLPEVLSAVEQSRPLISDSGKMLFSCRDRRVPTLALLAVDE